MKIEELPDRARRTYGEARLRDIQGMLHRLHERNISPDARIHLLPTFGHPDLYPSHEVDLYLMKNYTGLKIRADIASSSPERGYTKVHVTMLRVNNQRERFVGLDTVAGRSDELDSALFFAAVAQSIVGLTEARERTWEDIRVSSQQALDILQNRNRSRLAHFHIISKRLQLK